MATQRMPSKAQARSLAKIWLSDNRQMKVMVEAPVGRDLWNSPTHKALVARGWVQPSGYPPEDDVIPGFKYERYCLSFEGIVALHRFIGREIELTEKTDRDLGEAKVAGLGDARDAGR